MRGLSPAAAVWVALAAVAGFAAAGRSPWSTHDVLRVRLVEGAAAADGDRRLGLHFVLEPGWHVYWRYPGDAGAAPQVAFFAGGGETAVPAKLRFPAPHRFALPGGLEALGYEHEVVYPVAVTAPRAVQIRASVDYVACAIECIPFHDDLALDGDTDGGEEALLAIWEERVPVAESSVPGLATRFSYARGPEPAVTLEFSGAPLDGAVPELFLEPGGGVEYGSPARHRAREGVRFVASVRPTTAGAAPSSLPVAWTITGLRSGGADVAVEGQAKVSANATIGRANAPPGVGDAAPFGVRALLLLFLGAILPWAAALPAALASSRWRRLGTAAPFLAVAALVVIARALVGSLPSASLAILEVSWLAAALGARSMSLTTGKRRWTWVVFALAASLAAWRLVP
jgi:DsbC/DsbD-like thiol-disulfide interchange protein